MADRAFRVRFRAGGGGRDARKLGAGRFVETGFIWYIALTGTRSNIYHEESFRALLKGLGRRSINFFMYGNGGHDPAPNLIDLPAATGSKYQVSSSLRLAADVPLDARTPSLPAACRRPLPRLRRCHRHPPASSPPARCVAFFLPLTVPLYPSPSPPPVAVAPSPLHHIPRRHHPCSLMTWPLGSVRPLRRYCRSEGRKECR